MFNNQTEWANTSKCTKSKWHCIVERNCLKQSETYQVYKRIKEQKSISNVSNVLQLWSLVSLENIKVNQMKT